MYSESSSAVPLSDRGSVASATRVVDSVFSAASFWREGPATGGGRLMGFKVLERGGVLGGTMNLGTLVMLSECGSGRGAMSYLRVERDDTFRVLGSSAAAGFAGGGGGFRTRSVLDFVGLVDDVVMAMGICAVLGRGILDILAETEGDAGLLEAGLSLNADAN